MDEIRHFQCFTPVGRRVRLGVSVTYRPFFRGPASAPGPTGQPFSSIEMTFLSAVAVASSSAPSLLESYFFRHKLLESVSWDF